MLADIGNGEVVGYDSYGEGPLTLLLLHAFPFNRGQLAAQGEALGRVSGVRVVTMDLRGFGESSIQVGSTTMDEMAEDVRRLLDALNLDRVVLGGLSLGGYVAFAAYGAFRERIQGLILADTRASADTPDQRAAREDTALFVEQNGPVALMERDLPKLFSPVTISSQPEVLEAAREIAAGNSDIGVAAAARGMALRPDSTGLLPEIRRPTLVLVGAQDAIVPMEQTYVLSERIPQAELEVIPDVGHISNMERPDLFNERVARFLHERIAGASQGS
jgi:3-oxoadipate enol-lactonase